MALSFSIPGGNNTLPADKIALIRDLDPQTQAKVAEGTRILRLRKGDCCFRNGDPANEFYILCKGLIKIYQNSLDGREQILYIYSVGDFVGGLNLLTEESYRYYGEALEETLVAAINVHIFKQYLYDNPLILRQILRKSYDRIRWAEALIQRLNSGNAETKVASVLLQIAEEIGEKREDGLHVRLPMSREELGSYAGLTRETTARKLSQMKRQGILAFTGQRGVIVKDLPALKELGVALD